MSHNQTDLQPLGLTVHNPPSIQALRAQAHDAQRQRTGRWKMLAVLLVCAAPVVASYFTYYVIRPEGRRNFGELIEPQRTLPVGLMARTLQGQEVPLAQLQGQWLLLSTAPGACDAACEQHLYLQRQLRESLGRDKDRVDRVWLIPDQAEVRPALLPALAQARMTAAFSSTSDFSGPFSSSSIFGAPCRISLAKSRLSRGKSRAISSLRRM